jgi:hypothetical protein
MKKIIISSLILAGSMSSAVAQVVIDSSCMPIPNEVHKKTEVTDLGAINYLAADSNFVWNFSAMDGIDEVADTFVSVNSTLLAYIAVFNNPLDPEHRAKVATPQPSLQSGPGMDVQNPISFYKWTSSYYGQVGYGAEINGIPVPVRFDNADVLYRFPMNFNDRDTSETFFDINIPSLGYYSESRYRVNHVDGWGTLIVPGDTFQVMRIASTVDIRDSIYVDSLGFGFGFDRTEVEYKWLCPDYRIPVFHVIERSGGMGGGSEEGWFIDHRDHTSVTEHNGPSNITLYPNPANEVIILPGNHLTMGQYSIYDLNGRLVLRGCSDIADTRIDVSSLRNGSYFLLNDVEGRIFFSEFVVVRD